MADKNAPRLNCGWNITQEDRQSIINQINQWRPRDYAGIRAKRICELAFIHNMNATQIERENDPAITLFDYHGRPTKTPLGRKTIMAIIKERFPQIDEMQEKLRKEGREKQRRRNALNVNREAITEGKPKICAICGSVEDLRLHHIVPVDHGGTNDPLNLIFLCAACHYELHRKIYKTWGDAGQAGNPLTHEERQRKKPKKEDAPEAEYTPTPKREKAGKPIETIISYDSASGETTIKTSNKDTMRSLSLNDSYTKTDETRGEKKKRVSSMTFTSKGKIIRKESRKE